MRSEAEDAEASRRPGLYVERRVLHLLGQFSLVLEPSDWYVDLSPAR